VDLKRQRDRLATIIFDADTRAGKAYDVALLVVIAVSVLVAMLDSVSEIKNVHGSILSIAEWCLTILFSLDYVVRLWCVERPAKYALSFFGVVDLLSVIPTYIGLIIPSGKYLATLRFLRILRMFRVLKLSTYQAELQLLLHSLMMSRRRITVFLFFVLTMVVVLGSLMYTIEYKLEGASGFTSIPRSIYWAIVTLTTVGYGDVSPQTGLGQTVASLIMILGYSLIVVPTGIVASSMSRQSTPSLKRLCPACPCQDHDSDADFCKQCGHALKG
jgi:voltage-gated potassium channel